MTEEETITREHLQKIYDEYAATHPTPRELPKIEIDDTEFYVDGRLHEIRPVDDPNDRVTFDEIDTMNRFADTIERRREDKT